MYDLTNVVSPGDYDAVEDGQTVTEPYDLGDEPELESEECFRYFVAHVAWAAYERDPSAPRSVARCVVSALEGPYDPGFCRPVSGEPYVLRSVDPRDVIIFGTHAGIHVSNVVDPAIVSEYQLAVEILTVALEVYIEEHIGDYEASKPRDTKPFDGGVDRR